MVGIQNQGFVNRFSYFVKILANPNKYSKLEIAKFDHENFYWAGGSLP